MKLFDRGLRRFSNEDPLLKVIATLAGTRVSQNADISPMSLKLSVTK